MLVADLNKLPDPPYDICISHEEIKQITNQYTGKLQVVNSIIHYHTNPSCVWIKDADFKPDSLQVPQSVDARLRKEQRMYLTQCFNIL